VRRLFGYTLRNTTTAQRAVAFGHSSVRGILRTAFGWRAPTDAAASLVVSIAWSDNPARDVKASPIENDRFVYD
jgi:hypothetical protein